MWKCKNPECGKTFPIPARKSEERKPLPTRGFTAEITRVIVERACCPYCEALEIEEVKPQ